MICQLLNYWILNKKTLISFGKKKKMITFVSAKSHDG